MPNPHGSPSEHHPAEARVAAAYVQPLLELVTERGLSLSSLAAKAGLPENGLTPIVDSMSASSYVRLLDAGALLSNDEHFGLHVGERVKLGTYNVYGMILMSCKDFRQAFQQTMRYEGLAHDLGRSALLESATITEYQWHSHFPQASCHLADSVFAGIRVFGNWFAGSTLPFTPVFFQHSAPADLREYQRIFGPEVVFDAAINCAKFPTALLDWGVPNADVSMYPLLQQHAEQLLKQKQVAEHDGSVVALVRAAIRKNLSQDLARLPAIATELGVSQRTLQRKLSEAGMSFQQLLDETRRSIAKEYLQQAHFSLADIAFLLGFQEQSAFQHAFKEWTGMTPKSFRDQAQKR